MIERGDGSWEVRRGQERLAAANSYDDALDGAVGLAEALAPSAVLVHRANGIVDVARLIDA